MTPRRALRFKLARLVRLTLSLTTGMAGDVNLFLGRYQDDDPTEVFSRYSAPSLYASYNLRLLYASYNLLFRLFTLSICIL